ncbi:glutamate receptor ionotropic, kainate 2 isoform X3 [Bradysia coprophila]|uniref:glutamate receptor ionotropic, kainate 2 isoform X3 n=1 Tax=Bradysia coprophila TaxID=38358 RepID=UPI00187DA14A|nr:glutamate receptor ionotropic, kainate 2 isoform X3 [Bradysia coprophila]
MVVKPGGVLQYLKLFSVLSLLTGYTALPSVIKIGAIFTEDQKDSSTELAFKYGVYRINKDKNILPKTTLIYDISYVPRDDSFRATKKVCRQMELGVHAIFGPSDSHLGSHIQSICKALDVPHIETRFDFDHEQRDFSINLHPSQEHINNAYRDLIIFLNWTKVAIIYEEDYASGLFKQHELMKSSSTTELYIRQATPETYRQVLKEIRQKEIFKIIVDTNPHYINRFLRAILQLQMNDYRYHFMFTTFDIETFDLEDFKYNSVNITAFRLVDIGSRRVTEVLEQIQKFNHNGHNILNNYTIVQTEPALMFDAVYVFAAGLTALDRSSTLKSVNLSCELEQPWHDGLSLYNYLTSTRILGLTGPIEFYEGKRSNFKMDLLKLKREEIQKVGYWSPVDGISITDPTTFYESNTTNITLIVITREEKPYVMVKENTNLTGNARYEGFCVDLLKGIANQIGFQYSIKLVPDHMYGVYDPNTKTWNGIVRELMERRADLAVASMTINYARESVIDFTKPFMNLGIGILFKATSTRIVGGIWWFFTLIIISSYTANLAAFLTVERMITPIENAADLADQTEITYGTLEGGSTMTFFRDSKISIYQKMWRFMDSKRSSVFVKTYEEGINRVLEGNYAFLMESTMLDYAVQRNCNLTQIGGLLDSKGYGIATPKGSSWRDEISLAILELQEKGVIQILYDKWWKNTGDVCNRDDKSKESKANALGVENIGGVFVVLLCGLALAILIAVLEFCWNSKKNADVDRQSLCSQMAEELGYAIRCQDSRQRPALKRNKPKCCAITTYVPGTVNMSYLNKGMEYQGCNIIPAIADDVMNK